MDASPHFAPVVPPEVIGLIIDYLHDHPTSLKACGLVNHNFLASSRFHLYAGVSLTRRNLRAFMDSVKVPKNTWTVCLRSLHAAEFEHKDLIQLWPFLPTLSHLRSLTIHGHPITFDDNLIETQSIHSVRSLALSRATFSSFRGLTAFLLRFLSLRALKPDRISFQTTPPSASPVLSKALNLEALSMPLTPEMMAWLEWTKFSFRAELIELDVKRIIRPPGFSELSPLQYNTALRSIRVTQAFWIVKENDIRVPVLSAPIAARPNLRKSRGTGSERSVHVDLSLPQEAAEIIDGVGFARLQRIDFYGPWDTTTDILATQFRTAILALLPVQHARGIVHIGGYKFE